MTRNRHRLLLSALDTRYVTDNKVTSRLKITPVEKGKFCYKID